MRFYKYTVLAAAIASSFSFAVQAEGGKTDSFTIEKIMVTAQKKAQLVDDTGVSITAFGGNDIKELGFDKPQDIAYQTPGLSATNATSSGTPVFAIRGIGLDDFSSNNTSGVGVYIDEVLAAYPVFLNGQLFDVQRVEVLRGPQGTLYGKNTTGGAINYVSVKPRDEFEGYFSAGVSSWNTYEIEAALSGALTDKINSRLALSSSQGDGWQKDIDTGREFGDTDNLALRSLTTFELGDDAELLLNLHYSMDEGTAISPQNLTIDTAFSLPAGTLGVVSGDPSDVRVGDLDLEKDEEGYGASINLTIYFDAFTLTSITAADIYEREAIDNYDGVAINTDDFFYSDEFEVYSQELRIASEVDSFSWIVGLAYSYDKVDAQATVDTGFLTNGILTSVIPDFPGIENHRVQSVYSQKSTSFGAFLHTETYFTDELTLTVGLRYSQDTREFIGQSTDLDGMVPLFTGAPEPIPGYVIAELDDKENEQNLSGKIGLDYALDDDWLLYASIATSYKAGVFYAAPAADPQALAYIDPEEVLAYELGFKGSLLDNTMQINAAYYQYQYDDRQSRINAVSPTIPGLIFATLGNIEESEISGGELEFRWLPLHGLDMRVGVSYIDSEVLKAPDTVRGLTLATPIEEGDGLPQAPQWSYNAVVRYEWAFADMYIASAQAQYSWTDEQSSTLAGTNVQYGEVDKLGLRFAVGPADGSWELAIWTDNLENQNASTYSFTSTEGGQVVYRQLPRNYGAELTYNF